MGTPIYTKSMFRKKSKGFLLKQAFGFEESELLAESNV